jgi:hypothetical protein
MLDSRFVCIEKLLIMKNHFKHLKARNHKKHGRGIFTYMSNICIRKVIIEKVAPKLSITLVFKRVFV